MAFTGERKILNQPETDLLKSDPLGRIVHRTAEAVLASSETVEQLATRVDAIAVQMQQQSYQIFALSEAVQTLVENQDKSLQDVNHLSQTLQRLAAAIEAQNS
ncbi:MAG: hypothetical protein AAGF66_15240 [Cyanobacteria bacterium P01_H01_bin.119]